MSANLSAKPTSLPGRGSIWEHHKGDRYRVTEVSRHSEFPDRWLISYRREDGSGDAWTRRMVDREGDWPGFFDVLDGEGLPHRFRHVSGPRSWLEEAAEGRDAQAYLDAALRHGQDTNEPDHKVGDLQDLLRAAWGLMTVDQRTAFRLTPEACAVLEAGGLAD